jgi:RHS repeat-associated protein
VGVRTQTIDNNFRFAGQYFDHETGLHYNYHRYYDPQTGRYLTPDPIGLAGGINLFLYANLNPINAIDPLGLKELVYNATAFGGRRAGFFNFTAKTETDWRAGTAKSGVETSVAHAQWKGDKGKLSGNAGVYHWRGELSGGMTNVYSLGGIEGAAKIAAYEVEADSIIKIGSIYLKPSAGGTLGSIGAEGKVGLRGIRIGLHAIVGFAAGLEWGYVDELKCE